MSFTGQDYHQEFEIACRELPYEGDPDALRSKLVMLEWILWEALRGVFFWISLIIASLIVFPISYLVSPSGDRSWSGILIVVAALAVLATAIYWICRLVFYFEFAIKIHGRKFGDPLSGR